MKAEDLPLPPNETEEFHSAMAGQSENCREAWAAMTEGKKTMCRMMFTDGFRRGMHAGITYLAEVLKIDDV